VQITSLLCFYQIIYGTFSYCYINAKLSEHKKASILMSVILDQINKAEEKARRSGINVHELVSTAKQQNPDELATSTAKRERHAFLRESLGDVAEADRFFERILAGNELQDFNYLERGSVAGRAVARIKIRYGDGSFAGWGTGFLIAHSVLLTNNHVLESSTTAGYSEAHFGFERDYVGQMTGPYVFALEPERLFYTCADLDFTIVAVSGRAANAPLDLTTFGCLPLVSKTGKAIEGEWLTIIQHPSGQEKQLCVRENKFIKRTENELWYSADTLAGSSGSPVFNNDWYVVALHHSGVPTRLNGNIQTIDGRDFNPDRDSEDQVKWSANEGIRSSRIVERLQAERGTHPLLQPVFNASPESARIGDHAKRPYVLPPLQPQTLSTLPLPEENAMTTHDQVQQRTVSVTLMITSDGRVSLVDSGVEKEAAFVFEARTSSPEEKPPKYDAPFDDNYDNRKGYSSTFFGKGYPEVLLPQLQPALRAKAAPLLESTSSPKEVELKYHNYSVVQHSERRLAIFSAGNIRADQRFAMSRPADQWRLDPRISPDAQLGGFYYKNNQFDRGHLTRREDLEFGTSATHALQSAADTCHWTNCTPQHAKFNQGKTLWQGLERYVLEEGVLRNQLRIQVFTGPVFEEDDPVYKKFKDIQYPVRFWKVVVAPFENDQLSVTGYILDQSEAIQKYGVEATAPFGEYRHFQVPVSDIEELTQLRFEAESKGNRIRLSEFDPLRDGARRRRHAPLGMRESTAGVRWPERYVPLGDLEDIILM
jgi:endonuclease G